MRADAPSGHDWRDAAAYQSLSTADRSLFAWEWLRRDPLYRAAAFEALSEPRSVQVHRRPGEFGLVAFEPPDLTVPDARPLWCGDTCPYVLEANRLDLQSPRDMFDLGAAGDLASLVCSDQYDHLLLSDGWRTIRLDGPRGSFANGPVMLGYVIKGLAAAEPPLLTLQRFLALCRTGRFARGLHPQEVRARRWILMLRAQDALAAGAGQREIAQILFSSSVVEPGWRSREPSVRSRAQLLVRVAGRMAAGRYRRLLGPDNFA